MATLYDQAVARVDSEPRMAPYRDFILADWPEGDEHWQWVIDTATDEIIDWAESGMEDWQWQPTN